MSKENRANLIFVIILVLVIAPGFFILMKKKLSGPSTPNYMPDPVQNSIAYVHPAGGNPNLPRIEPPEARIWVNKVIQDRFNPTATVLLQSDKKTPLQSNRFQSQAILLDQTESRLSRFVFLIWNETINQPDVRFTTSSGESASADVEYQWIALPPDVLHALQKAGYPMQLTKVMMVIATNAKIKSDQLADVLITTRQGDKTTQETIHVTQ